MPQVYHKPWALLWVQLIPDAFRIGPVHRVGCHADGSVMYGVVGAQQGGQDVHETLPKAIGTLDRGG